MNKVNTLLLGIAVIVIITGTVFAYILFTNPGAFGSKVNNTSPKPTGPTEVVYDGQKGFVPAEVTVSRGETVLFKNNRSQPMWVASDPHPVHTDYEAFDTGKVIGGYPEPGEDFSFTFNETGKWTYHDHADPSKTGTIIVK